MGNVVQRDSVCHALLNGKCEIRNLIDPLFLSLYQLLIGNIVFHLEERLYVKLKLVSHIVLVLSCSIYEMNMI